MAWPKYSFGLLTFALNKGAINLYIFGHQLNKNYHDEIYFYFLHAMYVVCNL